LSPHTKGGAPKGCVKTQRSLERRNKLAELTSRSRPKKEARPETNASEGRTDEVEEIDPPKNWRGSPKGEI